MPPNKRRSNAPGSSTTIIDDTGQAIGALFFGAIAPLLQPNGVFVMAAGVVAFIGGPAVAYDWRHVL